MRSVLNAARLVFDSLADGAEKDAIIAAIANAIRGARLEAITAALAVCDSRHGAKYAADEIRKKVDRWIS